VIRAAGLRDDLTFTSFRHEGFTEAADSDLTDAEIRAQGRHRSAKVLPRYAKRTMKQVAEGAKKRRRSRGVRCAMRTGRHFLPDGATAKLDREGNQIEDCVTPPRASTS
jgi:hypothetical protein